MASTRWRWEARRAPAGEEEGATSPFLDWWEVRFRRDDDPDQEARVRAGVPDEAWSEELLRSVLRSARERTWRDADGALWTVRLEGWTGSGISTEVAEGEAEEGRRVVFVPEQGGESVRRPAPELASLTVEADRTLQRLLEGGRDDG